MINFLGMRETEDPKSQGEEVLNREASVKLSRILA